MNTYLVTGAAGFIGLHLSKLIAKTDQVILLDIINKNDLDKEFKTFLNDKNVCYKKIDLCNKKALFKIKGKIDYIFHLAATVGVKQVSESPDKVLKNNTISLFNMIDFCKEKNIKKIVFSSTSEVYAGGVDLDMVPVPTPEEIPLVIKNIHNPRFSYAVSKIAGEAYTLYSPVKSSIVRFHNIYGPRMGYKHVISEGTVRILKGENPLKVYGADEYRAFCYVTDAVNILKKIILSEKTDGLILHIGNDSEEIKIYDLFNKMNDIIGKDLKLEKEKSLPGSVKRRCPDLSLLRKLFNYEAKFDLDKGLRKTIEWYKNVIC